MLCLQSSQGLISTYLHTSPQPGLGRIAGILFLEVDDSKTQVDAFQHVGSELAMHVVVAKPLFLTKELVPSDALENEYEILKSQVRYFVIFLELSIGPCSVYKSNLL